MLKAAYFVCHPPILLPEVGKGEEKKIEQTKKGYEKVAKDIARLKPDTIVIVSPHAPSYYDYLQVSAGKHASGSMAMFDAKEVVFEETYDQEFVKACCKQFKKQQLPAGLLGNQQPVLDHGTMVPLYFIEQQYQDFKLVRFSVSGLDQAMHRKVGTIIKEVADHCGKDIVFVASGDLSHKLKEDGPYGYCLEGEQFDDEVVRCLQADRFEDILAIPTSLCEKSAQCGLPSLWMLSGVLQDETYTCRFHSYERVFGVGYVTATFAIHKQDAYVDLARKTLNAYVCDHQILDASNANEEIQNKRAGAFVSIHKHGELRGCIGTIDATKANLAQEIISNAIAAATRDPRFSPIRKEELSSLEISVDELKEPEIITSFDELDIKRYGVIVSTPTKCGLLLPNLDGVTSIPQQVSIALQKAGIRNHESYQLERFEVIRHEEGYL